LYLHPRDRETALFLGDAVLLPAIIRNGLADCALAPLIWRLPSLGVELPREARVIDDYGERIFRNPGFTRSLTEEEKALRA